MRDASWKQETAFFFCDGDSVADSADYTTLHRTWDASYFYMINQEFYVTQCVRYYSSEAKCNNFDTSSAYLSLCFHGTGGPFGASLTDSLYTLQRIEFNNATVTGNWKAWARMNGDVLADDNGDPVTGWYDEQSPTAWCDCGSDTWDITFATDNVNDEFASCMAGSCPIMYTWLTYPHYNTYKVLDSESASMTMMVEDVLTEFDSLDTVNMIPAPATVSVTPTPSATVTISPSITPTYSPLGPYLTEWQQTIPRLNCDETVPVRADFDFAFGFHDGWGLSNFHYFGNVTGYPSTTTCSLGFRNIFTANIGGYGTAYIETAKPHGQSDSRTLLTVHPTHIKYTADRWRGTEKWNTQCQCDDNPSETDNMIQTSESKTIVYDNEWTDPLHQHGIADCCPLLAKYLDKSFVSVKQHDDKTEYLHHRSLEVSDFHSDWFNIDHDGTKADYFPTSRTTYRDDIVSSPAFDRWIAMTGFDPATVTTTLATTSVSPSLTPTISVSASISVSPAV
jgi:hypothetical protein